MNIAISKLQGVKISQLADDVRQYRLENGLTWKALGEKVSTESRGGTISPSTLWKIAHGQVQARELTAHRITVALGLQERRGTLK